MLRPWKMDLAVDAGDGREILRERLRHVIGDGDICWTHGVETA